MPAADIAFLQLPCAEGEQFVAFFTLNFYVFEDIITPGKAI